MVLMWLIDGSNLKLRRMIKYFKTLIIHGGVARLVAKRLPFYFLVLQHALVGATSLLIWEILSVFCALLRGVWAYLQVVEIKELINILLECVCRGGGSRLFLCTRSLPLCGRQWRKMFSKGYIGIWESVTMTMKLLWRHI